MGVLSEQAAVAQEEDGVVATVTSKGLDGFAGINPVVQLRPVFAQLDTVRAVRSTVSTIDTAQLSKLSSLFAGISRKTPAS
jgi:hypothetical protein